jgi:hypothetical protein
MSDFIAIGDPCRIIGPSEKSGHVGPLPPCLRSGGNESGGRPTGHCDRDFCSRLDSAHKIGGILAQFAQSHGFHRTQCSTDAT